MSELLEVLEHGNGHGVTPRLRIRCPGCDRPYVTNTHVWNAQRLLRCAHCRPTAAPPEPTMTTNVETLILRLLEADEYETAERVASARGLSVRELLARRPPRHPLAGAIIDLYVVLSERYSSWRIAHLTGRDGSSIRHALRPKASRDQRRPETGRRELREAVRRAVAVMGPLEALRVLGPPMSGSAENPSENPQAVT